jgi:ubiquinone/menaquinone biosynthesis C-methylase UbiE
LHLAKERQCSCINFHDEGFASGLMRCFNQAQHELIVTMDGDGSQRPVYLPWMLAAMTTSDLVIASRYILRGGQEVTSGRELCSRLINRSLSMLCSLPIHDLTGSYKMYRKSMMRLIKPESRGVEIHTEITIRALGHGFRVKEIPHVYLPTEKELLRARVLRYGLRFIRFCWRLRMFRNSIEFCDYDERAYNSRIPMQKVWQRTRYRKVVELYRPAGVSLDIGCGTGRVVLTYPEIIGLDYNFNSLRYLSHEPRRLVQSFGDRLPIRTESIDTIYCCEVAEHLPQDCLLFAEIARVLKPGGHVVMTTPDYGTPVWPAIEKLYTLVVPHAYGHTHISKYNHDSLQQMMSRHGLSTVKSDRMFHSILVMLFRKS